ncbi:MAG: hypothetical protein AB8I58_23705 [Anaerolineales bacterium]
MNAIPTKRNKRLIRIIAIVLMIYALIELSDCITLLLMSLGWIGNPYPAMAFTAFDDLLNNHPLWMLPVFLYFTSLRFVSALGLFRQRMWAFWTTVLVCTSTILWAPFLMPLTGLEMLMDGAILFLLLLSYFGSLSIFPQKGTNHGD